MSSAFFALDIARKALTVSQKAIDVTGHNIANADTEGYTRQRLVTVAVEPQSGISRLASADRGQSGGGAIPVSVDQIRSSFLDRQYWRENAAGSELTTRSETLAYVEGLINELSGNGLSNALAQFSASIQEASKNPVNPEFRTNLLQNALKMTETFRHYSTQLLDKQADLDHSVQVEVGQINDLARSIADYNSQIVRYELTGQRANDLRDKRSALLDELSGLVQMTAVESAQGSIQVKIGDQSLVDHTTARLLSATQSAVNPMTGTVDDLLTVSWADDSQNIPIDLPAGSLRARIDLRDGASPEQLGLPYLQAQLDRLAAGLIESFNTVHNQGYGLPNPDSNTNLDFFSGTRASDISVHPTLVNDINQIALSNIPITDSAQMGNNKNALALGALFTSNSIADLGSFSGYFGSFVSALAIECSHTDKNLDGQKMLIASIDQQRQSVSGVSMDEEMTQLIRFEKSYAAAARLITTIDEMLDVLINRTGIVGR